MDDATPTFVAPLPLGCRLRRYRWRTRIKQSALAAELGVTQGMVSRWESGTHHPAPAARRRIEALLAQAPRPGADRGLRRLVEQSPTPVHLIRDDDHVLLAASPAREAEWGVAARDHLGRGLWRFATPAIVAREGDLDTLGWFDRTGPDRVLVDTGANHSAELRILASTLAWDRIALEDGRAGRLVTTIAFA